MAARKRRVQRGRTARTDVAGSSRRLTIVRVGLVLALVVAGGRLVQIQGFEASALSEQSEQQRITKSAIPAERGSFVDRDGNVLAFSGEARKLSVTPRRMNQEQAEARAQNPSLPTVREHKREIARYLDRVLGDQITEEEVLDVLLSDTTFQYLDPLVDPDKAHQITEKYPQIGDEYRAVREYPAGTVGANLLGAATWDVDSQKIVGRFGLENSLDSVLAGKNGSKVSDTAMGSNNLVIPGTDELEPAVPGSDVRLTIDSDVQYTVQRKLADYVDETKARSGSAVVLDAKTGEVYALANDRSFHPGDSSTWDGQIGNPEVTSPYEPGSVNKVITAAGAIEDGIMRPDTVLRVPGSIEEGGAEIHDAWEHGTIPLTFTGVLAKSSNVGTLMTAKKLGPDRFNELVHKFGLGERTGIGIPGESPGTVPPRNQWSGTTFANLPIGQGLSMTVVQMAGMYQAIANDGVRVPPRVIDSEIRPDGREVKREEPRGVRVVSPETARTVRGMLRAVVQDGYPQNGTGPDAALQGYQIAGKTGTAQQPDPECDCYSNSKHWITFSGILPADNPRFVVGLMIDRPSSGTHESTTAAPLFHDIAAYLAQRYNIPLSDRPAPEQVLQPQ